MRTMMPDKRIAQVLRRMHEIVAYSDYSLQEKRLRAMAQLERLLEVVVVYVPVEQQAMVREVISLYEGLWPR